MDLTATVYSDEASMANGSNGESALSMVTPQIVEEPETGLVPQAQAQSVAGLYGDQRIFVNAPQYHWHVQGAVGVDDEARQHIVALAQRLHQFGHQTEERELELWHRLSNVADVPGVERRLATAQERWESEYNKCIAELSDFVNKEINDFRRSIVVMSDSLSDLRLFNTHHRESVQATSERMERVQNQMTSIRSDLKEQIERAIQDVKTELSTEFKAALDRKVVSLETYVESRVNEVRRETSSTLDQLKETVAAVCESQERMWRAIDGMSKDVQELVQKDAGTEEDEDTEPMPATEEPVLVETSAIAQPTPEKTVPARTFFTIPEEDVVSVKDSVTSGLLAHGSMEGMEAGGSSGQPAAPQFKSWWKFCGWSWGH